MSIEGMNKLIKEYASQRKQNMRPDQALAMLFKMRGDLSADERQNLSQKIREWEREWQQGKDITGELVEKVIEENKVVEKIDCPHCGKSNPLENAICYACGNLMGIQPQIATGKLGIEEKDKSFFSDVENLIFHVRGFEHKPLDVRVGYGSMLIGRKNPESLVQPDIDLNEFDAAKQGVSRNHATIQRNGDNLTLIDKDSANYTFINGERVRHNEVRILCDGDEVRFGNLVTRITFKRELKFT